MGKETDKLIKSLGKSIKKSNDAIITYAKAKEKEEECIKINNAKGKAADDFDAPTGYAQQLGNAKDFPDFIVRLNKKKAIKKGDNEASLKKLWEARVEINEAAQDALKARFAAEKVKNVANKKIPSVMKALYEEALALKTRSAGKDKSWFKTNKSGPAVNNALKAVDSVLAHESVLANYTKLAV